jgi:hypothetical protein
MEIKDVREFTERVKSLSGVELEPLLIALQ